MARKIPEQAAQQYRESAAILEALVTSSPASIEFQRDVSVSYQHLADAFIASGHPEEALS
jgi:hypothetical protein